MIIEGELLLDRVEDSGDLVAMQVNADEIADGAGFIAVELRSVLGDDWWNVHSDQIPHAHGLPDLDWVAGHHPEEFLALEGKRVRVTIEVIG